VSFVRLLCSFGLCHPNLICSVIILIIITNQTVTFKCITLPNCAESAVNSQPTVKNCDCETAEQVTSSTFRAASGSAA